MTDFTAMFQRLTLGTFNSFSSAPVYMGLNFTDAGDTTEVVAFVSPNKARFFTLSAEHFFGVEDIYLDVRIWVFLCYKGFHFQSWKINRPFVEQSLKNAGETEWSELVWQLK